MVGGGLLCDVPLGVPTVWCPIWCTHCVMSHLEYPLCDVPPGVPTVWYPTWSTHCDVPLGVPTVWCPTWCTHCVMSHLEYPSVGHCSYGGGGGGGGFVFHCASALSGVPIQKVIVWCLCCTTWSSAWSMHSVRHCITGMCVWRKERCPDLNNVFRHSHVLIHLTRGLNSSREDVVWPLRAEDGLHLLRAALLPAAELGPVPASHGGRVPGPCCHGPRHLQGQCLAGHEDLSRPSLHLHCWCFSGRVQLWVCVCMCVCLCVHVCVCLHAQTCLVYAIGIENYTFEAQTTHLRLHYMNYANDFISATQ